MILGYLGRCDSFQIGVKCICKVSQLMERCNGYGEV